jgi:SAM-dependent methyltransferase
VSTNQEQTDNEQQIEFWNDRGGATWAANVDRLDRELAPFGLLALDALRLSPGDRILDVGCGPGATTAEAARRAAPGGRAVGIDISGVLLALARRRAAEAGVSNVSFVQADAQTHSPDGGPFDAIISRFGVMFFADPRAAFARLHECCAPGARLAFVCWQPLAENPWYRVSADALQGLGEIEVPPIPLPGQPGVFALADPAITERVLGDASWTLVSITGHREILMLDEPTLREHIAFAGQCGVTAEILSGLSPEMRAEAERRTLAAWQSFADGGTYRVPRAAWLVTATA